MLSLSSHVAGLSPLPINLSSVTALPMEYGENDNVLISGTRLLEINSFLFLFLETLSLGPLKHHTRNLTTLRVPVWEVRGRQTGKESELSSTTHSCLPSCQVIWWCLGLFMPSIRWVPPSELSQLLRKKKNCPAKACLNFQLSKSWDMIKLLFLPLSFGKIFYGARDNQLKRKNKSKGQIQA